MGRWTGLAVAVTVLGLIGPASADDVQVNGTLRDGGDHKVLHVWGTHIQMGYAHGYLLADEVMALAEGYILPMYGVSPAQYELLLGVVLPTFDIPPSLRAEAEALVEGIRAAGVSLYLDTLERDLEVDDLLLANAASDLFGVSWQCSSISAWGEATSADPDLAGELAMARDLDWDFGGGAADLRDYGLVIAYEPTDDDEQRWVSVAFPGYFGCLSCMNESGIGAFQNQGNHGTTLSALDTDPAPAPINLTLRTAIEARDANGDGTNTIGDVEHAVTEVGRMGTYEIHLVSPADRSDPPAAILEANNGGTALRTPADEPLPGPDCVATTNHHRELYTPTMCSRYATIVEMVGDYEGVLDAERLWEIEKEVSWNSGGSGTVQTMRVVPARQTLDVAFADAQEVAPYHTPTTYTFDVLFGDAGPGPAGGDDDDDDTTGGSCQCSQHTGATPWAISAALLGSLALGFAVRRP
jgi:hypothetical protein